MVSALLTKNTTTTTKSTRKTESPINLNGKCHKKNDHKTYHLKKKRSNHHINVINRMEKIVKSTKPKGANEYWLSLSSWSLSSSTKKLKNEKKKKQSDSCFDRKSTMSVAQHLFYILFFPFKIYKTLYFYLLFFFIIQTLFEKRLK